MANTFQSLALMASKLARFAIFMAILGLICG